jgi:hypothetical protein
MRHKRMLPDKCEEQSEYSVVGQCVLHIGLGVDTKIGAR